MNLDFMRFIIERMVGIWLECKEKNDNAHGKVYLNVDTLDCIAILKI